MDSSISSAPTPNPNPNPISTNWVCRVCGNINTNNKARCAMTTCQAPSWMPGPYVKPLHGTLSPSAVSIASQQHTIFQQQKASGVIDKDAVFKVQPAIGAVELPAEPKKALMLAQYHPGSGYSGLGFMMNSNNNKHGNNNNNSQTTTTSGNNNNLLPPPPSYDFGGSASTTTSGKSNSYNFNDQGENHHNTSTSTTTILHHQPPHPQVVISAAVPQHQHQQQVQM